MLKKILLLLILSLCVLLFFSCAKEDMSITSSVVERFFIKDENRAGLSVYVVTDSPAEDIREMRLTDPSGNLSWTLECGTVVLNGITYTGSSDAVMPEGLELPYGEWKLLLVRRDGTVAESSFKVSETDDVTEL